MKINYYSYPFETGYGSASKAYADIIAGWPNVVFNHFINRFGENKITPHIHNFNSDEAEVNFIHTVPTEGLHLISPKAKNILSTVYEADKLTTFFARALNQFDEITVPCTWNYSTFQKYTDKKIHLLPHLPEYKGLPPESPKPDFMKNISDDTFVFLNVSEWVIRKNIENMLLAFANAFKGAEDVLFIFKVSKRDISKRHWGNLLIDGNVFRLSKISYDKISKKYRIKAPIMLIDDRVSTEDMRHLYHRADAYFTMTNTEGWGMGSFESAFYGKPVIATNYSGHLDFLKEDNAFLIPSTIVPFKLNPWDDPKYYSGFTTAEPDMDSTVDLLRQVYNDRNLAREKGQNLKKFVETNFTNERISTILKKIIFE